MFAGPASSVAVVDDPPSLRGSVPADQEVVTTFPVHFGSLILQVGLVPGRNGNHEPGICGTVCTGFADPDQVKTAIGAADAPIAIPREIGRGQDPRGVVVPGRHGLQICRDDPFRGGAGGDRGALLGKQFAPLDLQRWQNLIRGSDDHVRQNGHDRYLELAYRPGGHTEVLSAVDADSVDFTFRIVASATMGDPL